MRQGISNSLDIDLIHSNIHGQSCKEWRCDMAFIEPMHRNKPNITYLLVINWNYLRKAAIDNNLILSTLDPTYAWHQWPPGEYG